MSRLVTLVVIAGAVALVGAAAYIESAGGNSLATPAQYRRYFQERKLACHIGANLRPTPIGGITVWSGLTTVSYHLPPNVSPRLRRAFAAGCEAAGWRNCRAPLGARLERHLAPSVGAKWRGPA